MAKSRKPFVVAVTGRALFDLSMADRTYKQHGLDSYLKHMRKFEDKVLEPGPAFHLINALNQIKDPATGDSLVSIHLVSQNHCSAGTRLLHSIAQHNLVVEQLYFTGGANQTPYLEVINPDLFLSLSPKDVSTAITSGIPAARLMEEWPAEADTDQVRVAFDGDSVLFDNKSEAVYQQHGLQAFLKYEKLHASTVLGAGPFKRVLARLCALQSLFPVNQAPIRTALVTSRGGATLLRPLLTLQAWGLSVDEAMGVDGHSKVGSLQAFRPQIFFDDHPVHCTSASKVSAAACIPDAAFDRSRSPV
jgi:5'-nucleotidase